MQTLLLVLVMLAFAAMATAQDMGSMPMVSSPAKLTFGNIPNIPQCAKGAPLHGNPMQGAFVMEIKAAAGCKIPTHWHSTNETVGLISGRADVGMPKEKPQAMAAGAYVYLPAKNQHNFVCQTACTFYLTGDGAFDIHYVDDAGQEISADQALKMKAKPMKGMGATKTTTTAKSTTTTKTTTNPK
jgi:quercetin dioxygenase-like cupin family protein